MELKDLIKNINYCIILLNINIDHYCIKIQQSPEDTSCHVTVQKHVFIFFFIIPFTSLYLGLISSLLIHLSSKSFFLLSIKIQIEFHQQCTYSLQCLLFNPSADYWNKCLWIQHPKIWCPQYPGLSVPYSRDTFLSLNSDTHDHSFILVITSYCNFSLHKPNCRHPNFCPQTPNILPHYLCTPISTIYIPLWEVMSPSPIPHTTFLLEN